MKICEWRLKQLCVGKRVTHLFKQALFTQCSPVKNYQLFSRRLILFPVNKRDDCSSQSCLILYSVSSHLQKKSFFLIIRATFGGPSAYGLSRFACYKFCCLPDPDGPLPFFSQHTCYIFHQQPGFLHSDSQHQVCQAKQINNIQNEVHRLKQKKTATNTRRLL